MCLENINAWPSKPENDVEVAKWLRNHLHLKAISHP